MLTERQYQNWFANLRFDNFHLKHGPHAYRRITSQDIAKKKHMKRLGK